MFYFSSSQLFSLFFFPVLFILLYFFLFLFFHFFLLLFVFIFYLFLLFSSVFFCFLFYLFFCCLSDLSQHSAMVLALSPLNDTQWQQIFDNLLFHLNSQIKLTYSGLIEKDEHPEIPKGGVLLFPSCSHFCYHCLFFCFAASHTIKMNILIFLRVFLFLIFFVFSLVSCFCFFSFLFSSFFFFCHFLPFFFFSFLLLKFTFFQEELLSAFISKPSPTKLIQRCESIINCLCLLLGNKNEFSCTIPIENIFRVITHIFSFDGTSLVQRKEVKEWKGERNNSTKRKQTGKREKDKIKRWKGKRGKESRRKKKNEENRRKKRKT